MQLACYSLNFHTCKTVYMYSYSLYSVIWTTYGCTVVPYIPIYCLYTTYFIHQSIICIYISVVNSVKFILLSLVS